MSGDSRERVLHCMMIFCLIWYSRDVSFKMSGDSQQWTCSMMILFLEIWSSLLHQCLCRTFRSRIESRKLWNHIHMVARDANRTWFSTRRKSSLVRWHFFKTVLKSCRCPRIRCLACSAIFATCFCMESRYSVLILGIGTRIVLLSDCKCGFKFKFAVWIALTTCALF